MIAALAAYSFRNDPKKKARQLAGLYLSRLFEFAKERR